MRDLSLSLSPDFNASTFVMGAPVRIVVVLIGIKEFLRLGSGHLASQQLRPIGSLHRISVDDFSAINSQEACSFGAGILRQAKSNWITSGRAEHRIGHAGIAARRVENGFARVEMATTLALQNHRKCGSILD